MYLPSEDTSADLKVTDVAKLDRAERSRSDPDRTIFNKRLDP